MTRMPLHDSGKAAGEQVVAARYGQMIFLRGKQLRAMYQPCYALPEALISDAFHWADIFLIASERKPR